MKNKINKCLVKGNLSNQDNRKNTGITLIALVITIIILIIISSVSIGMILGNNGLINRAITAKSEYQNAVDDENKKLEEIYSRLLLADSEGTSLENIDMTTLKKLILNTTYPVGSIYIGTTDTNPKNILGGEWESYGEGRTLVGAGTGTDSNNESKSFTANSTGGEYNHTLTTSEMPSHTHSFTNGGNALVLHSTSSSLYGSGFSNQSNGGWWYDANKTESTISSSGQSQSHNIIQPYIVTYMWKRIS